jgi:glycosyltransferase involved in cell wall biosynthesis
MQHPKSSLIVEGWRFITHSYAITNQWQLLALLKRGDVDIRVRDMPFYGVALNATTSIFDSIATSQLHSLPHATADDSADVTLRWYAPYDFSLSNSRSTAVFGTSEFQCVPRSYRANTVDIASVRNTPNLKIITPSAWSAEGFRRLGFESQQVIVVPHGVDTETFRPRPEQRQEIRTQLSISPEHFVFFSVGAMTQNKGIDVLLKAFANTLQVWPQARLLLKGMDPTFSSKDLVLAAIKAMPTHDQGRVLENCLYLGGSLSNQNMASLYQAADVYVSPYRAEGFNIPVLEAAACGIPIICTGGGSTDDFVADSFCRKIESKYLACQYQDEQGHQREPNLDHLVALMNAVIEDAAWRKAAAQSSALHVATHFTWDAVASQLIDKLEL